MKKSMQSDFIVDMQKNTITVKRVFSANCQLVWYCHTKGELLDQWFAPEPLAIKTKSMEFSEGGHWLYAMLRPDGQTFWRRMDYLRIKPFERYTARDGFCNENGELNPELPRAIWDVRFDSRNETSLVHTVVTYQSLTDLKARAGLTLAKLTH